MIKNFKQIGILVLLLTVFAFSAGAYTAPTKAYPNGDEAKPLSADDSVQIKTGGLKVNGVFLAKGDNTSGISGVFGQLAYVSGSIIGSATGSSTVNIGSSVDVTGTVNAARIQADNLKHTGTTKDDSLVCSDNSGRYVLCNQSATTNTTTTAKPLVCARIWAPQAGGVMYTSSNNGSTNEITVRLTSTDNDQPVLVRADTNIEITLLINKEPAPGGEQSLFVSIPSGQTTGRATFTVKDDIIIQNVSINGVVESPTSSSHSYVACDPFSYK